MSGTVDFVLNGNLLPLNDRVFDLHGEIVPLTSNPTDGITGVPGTFDMKLPVGAGKIALVSTVPEPATLTIVGMGLVRLGFLRQRRAA